MFIKRIDLPVSSIVFYWLFCVGSVFLFVLMIMLLVTLYIAAFQPQTRLFLDMRSWMENFFKNSDILKSALLLMYFALFGWASYILER